MWQEKGKRGWEQPAWSEAYVLCQLCAATGAFLGAPADLKGAMRALDLALIMGAPQELARPFLGPVERRLMSSETQAEAAAPEEEGSSSSSAPSSSSSCRRLIPESAVGADCPYPLDGASSIPRVSAADLTHKSFKWVNACPVGSPCLPLSHNATRRSRCIHCTQHGCVDSCGVSRFVRADYWNSDKPLIVTGAMDDWEALQRCCCFRPYSKHEELPYLPSSTPS